MFSYLFKIENQNQQSPIYIPFTELRPNQFQRAIYRINLSYPGLLGAIIQTKPNFLGEVQEEYFNLFEIQSSFFLANLVVSSQNLRLIMPITQAHQALRY